MRVSALNSKLSTFVAVAAVSTTVAACGGSSGNTATSSPANANVQKPNVEWVVHVTGKAETPPGPSAGVGYAIIALHDSAHEVCWRFAHLHGFVSGTTAEIDKGGPHTNGAIVVPLSPGPALHHRGCVLASSKVMSALASNPAGYYVNIQSVAYPHGAVRAQL